MWYKSAQSVVARALRLEEGLKVNSHLLAQGFVLEQVAFQGGK